MPKLSEYLREHGSTVQARTQLRAQSGADGYELFELSQGLGRTALSATNTWIGYNGNNGATSAGEIIEVDPEDPLSQIALRGAAQMRGLNELSTAMDGGNDHWSPEKHQFLNNGFFSITYRIGRLLLNALALR